MYNQPSTLRKVQAQADYMLSRDTIKYIPALGRNLDYIHGSQLWGEHHFVSQVTFSNVWRQFLLTLLGRRVAVLLASDGLRPGMLLNIPQCTRQLPTAKHYQPKVSIVTRLRNHV